MISARPKKLSIIENVIELPSIDSTQELGRQMVASLDEDDLRFAPTAIIAREQSAGRGRGHRSWVSPEGGLYMTLGFPAPVAIEESLHFPLFASVIVAETLRSRFGIEASLKWPNDVLVGGKKLAGLLLELVRRPGKEPPVVLIGIGINVGAAPVPEATSVSAVLDREIVTDEVLDALLIAFDTDWFCSPARERILARWQARSIHQPGQSIRVRREENDWIEGVYQGLDEVGRLRLDVAGRVEIVASADVDLA